MQPKQLGSILDIIPISRENARQLALHALHREILERLPFEYSWSSREDLEKEIFKAKTQLKMPGVVCVRAQNVCYCQRINNYCLYMHWQGEGSGRRE